MFPDFDEILPAWKFRKGYARGKLSVTAPYETALLTPDDAVELFPHGTGLEYEESGGLLKSIRLRKDARLSLMSKILLDLGGMYFEKIVSRILLLR